MGWDKRINYVAKDNKKDINQLIQSIKSKYKYIFSDNFEYSDTPKIRQAIVEVAKDNKWFKRIDHGEILGLIVFEYFEKLDTKNIKNQLESLSNWIDG